MRIPSGDIPFQPLRHLWERHKEIARRLVAGDKPVEIARDLGFTEGRLSIIINSPAFKAHLTRLSADADAAARDVQGRLSALAEQSVSLLEQAILGPTKKADLKDEIPGVSPALRLRIAQDSLDRAGFGPLHKSITGSMQLTTSDIEELKKRAASSKPIDPSKIIEGTAVG